MSKKQLVNIISFTVIIISVESISAFATIPVGNTTVWWTFQSFILFVFFVFAVYLIDSRQKREMQVVQLYLLWVLFSCFRGTFYAQNYWDWKLLVGNAMALLMPIVAYSATNMQLVQKLIKKYTKFALPLFILLAPFVSTDAYGFYLMPVSLLILFLPVLNRRWKGLILGFTLLVLSINLGARSNVIKFAVALLLLMIYAYREILSKRLLETIRLLLIAAPFIFFILAITGTFNIFHMNEYIHGYYSETSYNVKEGKDVTQNLTSDTRTFLYIDVLHTAEKYHSWWIGRSPAQGYNTTFFKNLNLLGSNERGGAEVGILDIFLYTGVIGAFLYLLIFYRASYLAVNRSNNIFSKMLGLFIAFHWSYSWVEDISNFSLNYFLIWMMIGMCFSQTFRNMTNEEVKYWVRGIFSKRYAKAWWILLSRKTQKMFL